MRVAVYGSTVPTFSTMMPFTSSIWLWICSVCSVPVVLEKCSIPYGRNPNQRSHCRQVPTTPTGAENMCRSSRMVTLLQLRRERLVHVVGCYRCNIRSELFLEVLPDIWQRQSRSEAVRADKRGSANHAQPSHVLRGSATVKECERLAFLLVRSQLHHHHIYDSVVHHHMEHVSEAAGTSRMS